MVLKPQDVVVAMWIGLWGQSGLWTYAELARATRLSPSQALEAVRRAKKAGLLTARAGPAAAVQVHTAHLLEFLVHGVRYAFPADRGGITRGVPTSFGAPVFGGQIKGELPPVWPDPMGDVRGEAFSPLYRTVPAMALQDPLMYSALALVDAIRAGSARERAQAVGRLERLPWPGKR